MLLPDAQAERAWAAGFLCLLLIFGLSVLGSSTSPPAAAQGVAYSSNDDLCPGCHQVASPGDSVTWTSPLGTYISRVVIRAGDAEFSFTSSGSDGCYTVSGIGSRTATASRTGSPGPTCQEMSEVRFYYDCGYVPCAETTDRVPVAWGAWYYRDGEWCRDVTYKRYDVHDGRECETKVEPECEQYEPCTEMTDWVEVGRGDPYYQDGEWCRDIYEKKHDLHDPTHECQIRTRVECGPYTPCTETTDWIEVSRGDWYYDAGTGKWCQDIYETQYDLHDRSHECASQTRTVCEDYQPCTETTSWIEFDRSDPYHDDGKWCEDVYERKYDLHNPAYVCDSRTRTECEDYKPCTETTGWVEVGRGTPYYDEGSGQWCHDVYEKKYDLHDRSHECGSRRRTECEGYRPCTETTGWLRVSATDWMLDPVTNRWFRFVTYEKNDLHDSGVVCDEKTEREWREVPTPTPPAGCCNSPRISPAALRQGESLRVQYSAWCPDVYKVTLSFLGDARDSPPGKGWRAVASAGNRVGGTYSMSTAGLYPGARMFQVRAYHPGGWSDCYGTFRLVGMPKTGTPPAPGLAPCPICVEPLLLQSNCYGDWDIFVADAHGAEPRRLTADPADDTSPVWHPSGGFIAFQSRRDGDWEVYTMNGDGSKQLNVSENPAADTSPAWSCRHIFFQSDRDGNWEIYRMQPDGSQQTRLTDNAATDVQPAVSCNDEVAFQSNRDGNWELYAMDSDGHNVRRLTNTAWDDVSPTWSPDGRWIVFQTKPYGVWKLAAVDASGGNLRHIARTFASTESPAWYPYCDWIYFQSNRSGVIEELYRTKWDSDLFARLTWTPFVRELIDSYVLP